VSISTQANSGNVIISTGIGKPIQVYGISGNGVSFTNEFGTGGAVEAIMQQLSTNATVLAYQVSVAVGQSSGNANGLLSVIVEDNQYTASTLQADIRALGSQGNGPINLANTLVVGGLGGLQIVAP
jgi:hypothetical protein